METNLFLISALGLAVGIICSMPSLGPVSILIVSHALKGQLRYCQTVALGASIIDFMVCFIAVYGFASIYTVLARAIPYILCGGAIVLFLVGVRIIRARFDFEHMNIQDAGMKSLRNVQKKNGFWMGVLVNVSNPSIFIGWPTSSLVILSFAASCGLNVGGLEQKLANNVTAIGSYAGIHTAGKTQLPEIKSPMPDPTTGSLPAAQEQRGKHQMAISLCYAFFIALGTNVWFFILSLFLSVTIKKFG